MAGQAAVLELMVKGAPLTQVLEALCDVVDQQATDRRHACILLTQEDGLNLRPVAGRHLPAEWMRGTDPWPICPLQRSSAGAGFGGEPVRSRLCVALWAHLKSRREASFRSCLVTHLSSYCAVLGTFALYYQRVHHPATYAGS